MMRVPELIVVAAAYHRNRVWVRNARSGETWGSESSPRSAGHGNGQHFYGAIDYAGKLQRILLRAALGQLSLRLFHGKPGWVTVRLFRRRQLPYEHEVGSDHVFGVTFVMTVAIEVMVGDPSLHAGFLDRKSVV